MSDMDSDCDDVFTDDSKGPSLQDDDNCHMINRKRRRGIIEKRRRDRINNSLTELRRLVPAAFEKQGSAKLEKAEILQMTVDHLKILHSKGMDSFTFESQKFTMDYHGLGFRECTAEIARYLVGMEGRDLQDPLRMRLMSHLQCFAAQRDLALKSSSPSWTSGNSLFGTLPAVPTPQYPSGHPSIPSPLSERIFSSPYSSSSNSDVLRLSSNRASSSSSSLMSTDSIRSPGLTSRILPPLTSVLPTADALRRGALDSPPLQLTSVYRGGQEFVGDSPAQPPPPPVRPYRPWGTEMAY